MRLLAIDPGYERSAIVGYDCDTSLPVDKLVLPNEKVLFELEHLHSLYEHLAIEMIASYGMPVGREIFETVLWIGRYVQVFRGPHTLVYRREVKLHLCGSARAKDANVRQAILDRFGGMKAKGTKRQPGPLHGFRADLFAALGVAVTWADLHLEVA